ncbi:MAG TPA: RAMP superfamily CRISPR-associated protein [Thermoanaerobaculia bacterium]|nr:RAMP superfamily CRISPR-associated protein [Thermoanaerobaculia bacterium]
MRQNRLRVTLTLAAPILTRSSAAGQIGVDAPVARKADGRCYLPFSLVKGRTRQSWDELGQPGTDDWFGTRTGGWNATRGRFRFGDFTERRSIAEEPQPFRGRHRIRIDGATGAAREGALQVIESPFGAGEEVVFEGDVTWFSNDADAAETARLLESAFRWTPSFGAGRTIGFGRVASVACTFESSQTSGAERPSVVAADDGMYSMSIRLGDPLCLARRRIDENLFASDDVIPGAVVRGVAATTLNRLLGRDAAAEIQPGVGEGTPWAELADHFNEIRLRHSFPAADGDQPARPVVPPLSIVRDRNRDWWDVAACDGPGLIGGGAPEFAIDWKGNEGKTLSAEFGWPEVKTEIRVRTAIDRTTKRAADAQLFAYEMIEPDGLVWLGKADFSAVDASARAAVAAQFQSLFALEPAAFGKTKARGRIVLAGDRRPAAAVLDAEEQTAIVTLQTPALLCDPARLDETSGRDALFDAYAAAWDDISGGTLRLIRFFASQTLAGGYLLHRFQSGKPYAPFLLTDRGSVFVLEGDAAVLAQWMRTGLPLPQWARSAYGASWKENPYLPEDGYGEIAVNLDCHRTKKPADFRLVAAWEARATPARRVPQALVPPPKVATRKEDLSTGMAAKWTFTNRWRIAGRLTTASDFHLGSGEVTTRPRLTRDEHGAAVDISAVAVDAEGRAYLPGSSLKGALRSWLTRHADADLIASVFGDERDDSAQAGKAEFHDAFCRGTAEGDFRHVPYWDSQRRTGVTASVALDRWTRAAREQKLFHREYVPPGVAFDVVITGQDLDEQQSALLLFALRAFGRDSDAVTLGSETREGWGRFTWSGEVVQTFSEKDSWRGPWDAVPPLSDDDREALIRRLPASDIAPEAIAIDLAFEGPFLVNEPSRAKPRSGGETPLPDHAPRLDRSGAAVLPVSSFRGALRAQAERIVRTLGGNACHSTDPATACSDIAKLCVTCRLFGAPGWASPLSFSPFRLTNAPQPYHQELVAIDRFTGGVSGKAKFDLDAVWKPSFYGTIAIAERERIDDQALGVLALALRDLAEGDIPLGFGASKGFGQCHATCSWPAAVDASACVEAFRKTIAPAPAAPLPEPGERDVVRQSDQPHAQAAPADDVFHNPYAFVPITRSRQGDLDIAAIRSERAGGVTHDLYAPATFSGRILCRLETETPMIVGARQEGDENEQRNEPKVVHPFLDPDSGRAAIPSTTLRGVISSVAEAASNSALRILDDAALTYRSPVGRKRVDGSIHEFFREVSDELLPMNPARKIVTPAEQLFGYVEIEVRGQTPAKNRATALAGRVRFSMARRDGTNAPADDFLDESILQPLLSPKPPSPNFYFRPKNGTGPIAKRALTKREHVPQGRKMYLHAPANWRRDGDGDRFSNRVRPVREGRAFWFHVDVDNLSLGELGLLLYSLRPTPAFRHKMGMGKALGLGTVRIDPVAILRVNRPTRYTAQALSGARYDAAWRDETIPIEQWPPEYAAEAAAMRSADPLDAFFERCRAAYRDRIDRDIRGPLELIGNPRSTIAPVHTPQVEHAEIGVESYQWFMRNERSSAQWLAPLDRSATALPLLSRLDQRIQHVATGPAPQMKAAPIPKEPEAIIVLTLERAALVYRPQHARLEAVAHADDGRKIEAWASKDDLSDYDTIVQKIKRKGELTARVTAVKTPEGRLKITRVEPL